MVELDAQRAARLRAGGGSEAEFLQVRRGLRQGGVAAR